LKRQEKLIAVINIEFGVRNMPTDKVLYMFKVISRVHAKDDVYGST